MKVMRFVVLSTVLGAMMVVAASSQAPSTASAREAYQDLRCTSAGYGWRECENRFRIPVKRCRGVGVRNLDSGNNRWIKVQLRKGPSDVRFESKKLRPSEFDNGRVAGSTRERRFVPRLFVDADGLTETSMTVRIRIRC